MGQNRFNSGSKNEYNTKRFVPMERKMTSQALVGRLLVASPSQANTPFAQTVILVMQQDEYDTFGIVLNQPANEQVASELRQITGTDPAVDLALIHGGPLNGPVFAIHQQEDLAEIMMPGGICVSSQLEILKQLEHQFQPYRIVLGMTGWKTSEVLAKIDDGQWLPLSTSPEQIFDEPDWMWQRAVLEYGRQTMMRVTGLDCTLGNPELN